MEQRGFRRGAKRQPPVDGRGSASRDRGLARTKDGTKRRRTNRGGKRGRDNGPTPPRSDSDAATPVPSDSQVAPTVRSKSEAVAARGRWVHRYKCDWTHVEAAKVRFICQEVREAEVAKRRFRGGGKIGNMLDNFGVHFARREWAKAQATRLAIKDECEEAAMEGGAGPRRAARVCFAINLTTTRKYVIDQETQHLDRKVKGLTARVSGKPRIGVYNLLDLRMDRAVAGAFDTGDMSRVIGLLNAGARPNFIRQPGESILHAAAFCGNARITSCLVLRGVKSAPDRHGNLPADLAAIKQHGNVLQMLQNYPGHASEREATIEALEVYEEFLRGARWNTVKRFCCSRPA